MIAADFLERVPEVAFSEDQEFDLRIPVLCESQGNLLEAREVVEPPHEEEDGLVVLDAILCPDRLPVVRVEGLEVHAGTDHLRLVRVGAHLDGILPEAFVDRDDHISRLHVPGLHHPGNLLEMLLRDEPVELVDDVVEERNIVLLGDTDGHVGV